MGNVIIIIIIIIIINGFLGLSWFYVGCVGISLVALVFRWLLSPR